MNCSFKWTVASSNRTTVFHIGSVAQHARRLALIASPLKSHKCSFRVDSVRINNCLHFNIFLLICMSVLDWKRMVNTSYADTTWVSTNLSMIHDSWMASYTPCVCFRLSWWTCGRSWQMSRQRRLWWRRRFTNNFCNSTPCSSNSKPKADRRSTQTPSRTGW